ncbi:MAG: ABC transporter substrate-binding protein [Bacteroidota bacterium]
MKEIFSMKNFALCLLILCVSACGKLSPVDTKDVTLPLSIDLFPEKVKARHAKNFSVTYHGNYKLVTVRCKLDDKSVGYQGTLVLVQRGTPIPSLPDSLKPYTIEIPAQTAAANDDGEILQLKSLGLQDNIVAMGGGGIYDEELRRRWEEKKIASIGYSFVHAPAPELLMSLNADVFFNYTWDHERLLGLEKLRELGVHAVPCFGWAEKTNLGNAEWIKFISLFFNREKEANELFGRIENRCMELQARVASIPKKVKAFWLYHPSDQSDWSAHRNDFMASFLESAGAVNVLKSNDTDGQVGMNNEAVFALAHDADFWIVNSTDDKEWPPVNFLNTFKSYRDKNVFHYHLRTRYEHDAFDWYETGEVRPDLVLEDLVSIFYPEVLPNHQLFFFEKVKLTKQ